jgi:hypothetical protein
MPTHYLHAVLANKQISQCNISNENKSAFLLGAIAPDAVPFGLPKRTTHYNIHFGLTWVYRFGKFEREFAKYRRQSEAHKWFYRGYKYHLQLDHIWVKTCLNQAMLRLMFNQLRGKGKKDKVQYYDEMGQYDDFYRGSRPPDQQKDICCQLAGADLALFPPCLDRGRWQKIMQHLEQTTFQTASSYQGELLPQTNIEHFMQRASKVRINGQY